MSINRKLSKLANLLDDATDNQYLVSDGNGELTFNDLTVSLIDSSNAITNSFDPVSTIRFDTDSGFDLTDLGSGAVKVGMNSTFKTWQVSGQDDLVALGLDTIEFVAGTGMTITTDATTDPKQIIFESSGTQLSTTDDLSEGSSNLYFTDARARNAITNTTLDMQGNKVLFGNMYATLADLPSATTYHGMFAHVHATGKAYFAHNGNWVELLDSTYTETTTTLTADSVNQKLVYTDETGTANDVDLSWAVDDTNLARLTSGTLNNTTGIATFTRDDSTTFTVDFSALFDDTNNYADSVSFSGGTLTIGRSGSLSDLTVSLDGRYLQSLGSVGGHTDVDITTTAPTTGQALVWDGSNFVPGDSFSQTDFDNAFALKSIDALSDVDTSTNAPATGDALVWDGSNFVPGNATANVSVSTTAPISPEIGDVWLDEATLDLYVYYPDTNGNIWVQVNNLDVPTQLNDLTDVNLTTAPTSGQTLVWDATNNVFIPGTIQGYTTTDFNTDFAAKTTTDLTEGTNLYYTDARVDTRIGSTSIDALNDVDTSTATANNGQALVWDGSNWVPGTVSAGNFTETVTTLTGDSVNQRLQYTDESGTVNNIDLSWAVDDTNLARITSGTLNNTTGIATFTRDDSSTFTVDFSALFDDTNNYADSVSFSGGTLTIGRTGSLSDLTVSLDGRYIQSLGSIGGHTDVDITTTAPSSGDALVWDGSNFVPGNATANVTVSTTAPSSPEIGDVWLDEATLDLYVYYPDTNGNIWVQVNNLDVPTQLNDLTDVDLTTLPTNGQTLVWNSTTSVFEPGTIQGYTTTDFNTDFATKTTTDLAEGTNLYFTDARADTRADTRIAASSINALTDVDTATSAPTVGEVLRWDGSNFVPGNVNALETLTTLTADSANSRLQYTDEAGTVNNIDLSWAVDDTNLARLVSGSLNGSTGVATFTRDDSTTFTVDFSPFFDDTNLARITSGSISGNTLTLTRDDASTIAIDVSSLIDIDSTSLVTVSGVGINSIDFSTISGSGISGGVNTFAFSYTGYAGGGYSGPAGVMELGRKYLEVEFTTLSRGAIGINGTNVDLTSGNVGGVASNMSGFTVGDVLGIVYDTTTREVYYSKNGSNWSPTDPNLGAGYSISGASGDIVEFDFRNTSGSQGSTFHGDLNTGAITYPLAYAVPPGTTPYSGTGTAQFLMDGAAATTLSFEPGRTYIFDQSDATNLGHPLKLSETEDGTHNSGSEYTIGVTTVGSPGTAGAYSQIVVNQATPHLYYYCANHSGMGGGIAVGNVLNVGDLADVDTTTTAPTDGQALVWDNANSKFVPGDSFSQTDFDNAISLKSIDALSDVDTTTAAPTSGDTLVWDGSNFVPGTAGAAVTVSATAPTGATEGDLWLNEDTLALYAWYVDSNSSQWVHINPYIDYTKANISATAPSNPDTGDLWVDEATLDVYIYTGSAWAQVNQSNIPTEISDLVDVDATGVADGQALIYSVTNSRFEPGTVGATVVVQNTAPTGPSEGDLWYDEDNGDMFVYVTDSNSNSAWVEVGGTDVINIDDLSDVDTSTNAPTNGQALVWDGTNSKWVPGSTQGYTTSNFNTDIGNTSVDALSDVDTTTAAPTSGQALVWDGSNFVPTTISLTETTTTLTADSVNQKLVYTDETGTANDVDLSWAVDDTNLARITSGTLNNTTGIATFTRDDSTTFTVDFSALFDDTNNYADSVAFSGGTLTIGRTGSLSDLTVSLDGRYLQDITGESVGDLNNVDITTTAPTDGQALVWDNANSKFVPGDSFSQTDFDTAFGNKSIQDLSNVVGSGSDTLTTGDFLLYDGSEFGLVNFETEVNTYADTRIGLASIQDLSDVDGADTPAAGDVLYHDGTDFGFVNFGSEFNSLFDTRIQTKSIDVLNDVDTTTAAPTTGDALVWNGTQFVPGNAVANVTVSTTAPSSPEVGDVWLDEATLDLYIYYPDTNGNIWVQVNNLDVPTQLNDLTDVDTATTAPTTGDALVWDGTNFIPQAPFSQSDFDTAFAAKTLDDLSDVNLTVAPTDGQSIVWDNANSEWIAGDSFNQTDFDNAIALKSIDVLSDVDTTTAAPVNGQVLKWDGSNFIPSDTGGRVTYGASTPSAPGTGDIWIDSANNDTYVYDGTNWSQINQANIPTEVSDLIDVDASGATNGQTLVYNSTTSQFEAGTISGYTDADVETYLESNATADRIQLRTNNAYFGVGTAAGTAGMAIKNNSGQPFFYGAKYYPASGLTDLELEANTGGKINVNAFRIFNVATPTDTTDAANKAYVDTAVSNATYTDSDVDTHLNVSGATANQVLSWNGSDYAWVADNNSNDYADSLSFSGGTLTIGRTGSLADLTVSLDGRYLQDLTSTSVGTLSDVDITTAAPTDGQALIWDNANSKFVPGDSFSQTDFDNAIALKSIDVLSDVDTTTTAPTTGDALVWDGTNFVPGDATANVTISATAPSSPALGDVWLDEATLDLYVYYPDTNGNIWVQVNNLDVPTQLNDLTDVNLTTAPTDGQALIWDNTNSVFVPGDSFSQTDFDNAIALKSIDALSDVDTTTATPTNGQALAWDGSNFVPTTISFTETTTTLTADSVNQKLVYTDETGTANDVDLSWAVDDTNLARLTSGTVNSTTGIATFTRDDTSTFTVDFSALLDTTLSSIDELNDVDITTTAPTTGETLVWDGSNFVPGTSSSIDFGATAPSNPSTGDVWIDNANLDTYVYTGSAFAQINQSNIPSEISDLVDADTTGIANGQVLVWNSTNTQFEPGDAGATVAVQNTAPSGPSEGDLWYDEDNGDMFVYVTDAQSNSAWVEVGGTDVIQLNDLSDVDLTTNAPTDGQVLVWDNANSVFVPGSQSSSIGDLTDVDITTNAPTDGQMLSWNATTSQFVPITFVSSGGGTSVEISANPPASPAAGDLWIEDTTMNLYVYYDDPDSNQWVQINNDPTLATQGLTANVATGDNPPSPAQSGDIWYNTTTGSMFVYYQDVDSSQWVEIVNPFGNPGIFELDGITAGTTGQVLTMNADSTATFNDLPFIPGDLSDLTDTTSIIPEDPAIEWDGTTATLATGVVAADLRTLIGAGTSSFDGSYNSLTDTPTIPSDLSELTDSTSIIPTDLTDLGIVDGTINQVLKTDGAGNFTFENAATKPTAYQSDSAPTIGDEVAGDLWYNTTDGSLYVYYQDADTTQWVQVVNPFAQLNLFDLEDITDGTANQVLTTDGAGNATFQDVPRDVSDLNDSTNLLYTDADVDSHLSTTGTGLIKATVDSSHIVELNRTTDAGDMIKLQLAGVDKSTIGLDENDNLTVAGTADIIINGTTNVNLQVGGSDIFVANATESLINSPLRFGTGATNTFMNVEGATDDAFETAFTVTEPTADRTVTFKDETGTVALISDIPTDLTDLGIVDGTINQVLKTDGAGNFTFEDAATRPTAYMGDNAPNVGDERAGDLWYNSTDGSLYVYYEDVDSTQWTQVVNPFAQLNLFDLEDITDGTANQVLTTDGAGNATFQDVPRDIEDLTDATSLLYTDSDVDTHLSTNGTGLIKAAVDSSHVLELNRTTDSGDMIVLQQDGVTEASIGIDATDNLVITSTNSDTIKLVSTDSQLEINSTAVTINKPLVLNSGAGNTFLTVEGTVDDTFETQFVVTEPTADRTVTFKDEDGTVAYIADLPTALTDLGITDGTLNQLLTTDGAGNFSFADREGVGIELSDTAPATAGKLAGDLWYNTNDGSLYILYEDVDSTQWVQIINPSPDGWAEVSGNYTAQGSAKLFVDTSVSAVTITLPASPVMGQQIHIIDGSGNAATNNITVARNGNLIDGAANDISMDYDRATLNIVYYNAANGWVLADN